MFTCPHCKKPGISLISKLFMGPPPAPSACKACGKEVGVPYSSTIIGILILIAVSVLANWVESNLLKIAIGVATALTMSVIYLKWVPLIPRS